MRRETRIIMEPTGDVCPTCGGELKETYSPEVGFCAKCGKQVKL